MKATSACPLPETLADFLTGRVTGAEADTIEDHLRGCDNCQLPSASADPLLDGLRGLAEEKPSAALSGLMDRLCALGPATLAARSSEPSGGVAAPTPRPIPQRMGRYRLEAGLGYGGMGSVYRAVDDGLGRAVAVKVPHEARDAARFLREAKAAAAVRHPNVCPVYDMGEDAGLPFVVMELVEGGSLEQRLKKEGKLAAREAARLVREAALGLQAVHDAGIVHRDIKPGNILLDGSGTARLTDFGLAKAHDSATMTADGALVGTPAYMAPEQVALDGNVAGPAADIYALGAVLYQAVTGQMPYSGGVARVLAAIEAGPPPAPAARLPGLDAALEAIILKAMARRAEDRFTSAKELAGALEGWLAGGVQAPPRPAARPPWWRIAAGLVFLIGGVALAGIIIKYRTADGKEKELKIDDADPRHPLVIRDAGKVVVEPADLPPVKTGDPLGPLALVPRPAKIEGVETWTLQPIGHPGEVTAMSYRPDGKVLASAGHDGTIRLWDEEKGTLKSILIDHRTHAKAREYPQMLAWMPDNRTLAASFLGRVTFWDTEAGKVAREINFTDDGGRGIMAISPNGKWLAAADTSARARLYHAATGKYETTFTAEGGASALAFSPDETALAMGASSGKGAVSVWDVAAGKAAYTLPDDFGPLTWSPDGRYLATGRSLHALTPGKPLMPVKGKPIGVGSRFNGGWATDGSSLVGTSGQFFSRWVVGKEKQMDVIHLSGADLRVLAFCADGKRMAGRTKSLEGILIHDAMTGKLLRRLAGLPAVTLSASPDGTAVAAQSLGLIGLRTGEPLMGWPAAAAYAHAWSPDGKFAFSHLVDGAGPVVAQVGEREAKRGLLVGAASPDGKAFFGWRGKDIVRIDPSTGVAVRTLASLLSLDRLEASADGKHLLGSGLSGLCVMPTGPDGKPVILAREVQHGAAFTADGKFVVAAGPRTIGLTVWEVGSWKQVPAPKLPGLDVYSVGRVGGKIALVCSAAVVLLDVAKGEATWRKEWYPATSFSPAELPGGKAFLIQDENCLVCLDAGSGQEKGRLLPLGDGQALILSPDGHFGGAPRVERSLVYVIKTAKGLETLTPADFAKRFGWKNDPKRAVPFGR